MTNNTNKQIVFEDFAKLEIRIGRVLSAEKVENADKLLKLMVDFGSAEQSSDHAEQSSIEQGLIREQSSLDEISEPSPQSSPQMGEGGQILEQSGSRNIKQILSGIAEFYKPEDLVGKEFPFIVNLEPRVIRGLESQGMILAADSGTGITLLNPDKQVPEGSKVR